jgi:hypothetical protein
MLPENSSKGQFRTSVSLRHISNTNTPKVGVTLHGLRNPPAQHNDVIPSTGVNGSLTVLGRGTSQAAASTRRRPTHIGGLQRRNQVSYFAVLTPTASGSTPSSIIVGPLLLRFGRHYLRKNTKPNFLYTPTRQNDTYDHRSVRTGHPVRSAIHKH